MFKPISRRLHGFLDYSFIPIVAVLPRLLGFGGIAALLCSVFSSTILLSTIFTRSEWGLFRILPFKGHLVIDFLVGALAVSSPWLFGFSDNVLTCNAFLVFGTVGVLAGLLSRPEEMEALSEVQTSLKSEETN